MPGPKRFNTARNEGIPEDAIAPTASVDDVTARPQDGELVLHEPGRPVEQVPVAHAVERVEEAGQRVERPDGRRRGPEPGFVQGADRRAG